MLQQQQQQQKQLIHSLWSQWQLWELNVSKSNQFLIASIQIWVPDFWNASLKLLAITEFLRIMPTEAC